MTRRLVLAALVLAALAAHAPAQSARDLWPLRAGNSWTYLDDDGQQTTVRAVRDAGGWVRVEGFLGSNWWWASDRGTRVWAWQGRRPGLVFDLGSTGTAFKSSFPADPCLDGAGWEIVDDAARVASPVGPFDGCRVAAVRRSTCADAGFSSIAFAPGFGIVEYSRMTIRGPITSRVVEATVDGRTYRRLTTGGIEVRASVDHPQYSLVFGGAAPPPGVSNIHPSTMKATFTIANGTNAAVKYRHFGGQEYDFVIYDARGTEVRRWSTGRAFHKAIWERTLAPGAELRFEESFELRNDAGGALSEGEYVLEAVHWTGPTPLRQSARVAFRIKAFYAP